MFKKIKISVLKKLLIIVAFILINADFSSSKDFLTRNDFIDEPSYFHFQHSNDVAFLFEPKATNDYALTASVGAKLFLNNKEKNRTISFGFLSTLYSSPNLWDFYENDRLIKAHYFTEISQIFGSIQNIDRDKNLTYKLETGLGLLNKDKAVKGLMLWLQGGTDGKGGYHGLIGNEAQLNLSRDIFSPFFYLAPSINKYFYLPSKRLGKPNVFRTELGINLCSNFDAFNIFLRNDFKYNIFRTNFFEKFPIISELTGQADLIYHADGLKFNPGFGIEIYLKNFVMGYSKFVQLGKEQISWVDFKDNENICRLYFRVLFREK